MKVKGKEAVSRGEAFSAVSIRTKSTAGQGPGCLYLSFDPCNAYNLAFLGGGPEGGARCGASIIETDRWLENTSNINI